MTALLNSNSPYRNCYNRSQENTRGLPIETNVWTLDACRGLFPMWSLVHTPWKMRMVALSKLIPASLVSFCGKLKVINCSYFGGTNGTNNKRSANRI